MRRVLSGWNLRRVGLGLATGLCLLVVPAPAVAQEFAASPRFGVAIRYLETLYAFDFDRLGEMLAPDAVFRDPTGELLTGAELVYTGREDIVRGFRAGAADSRDAGFEVQDRFASGEHVVLTVIYHSEIRGEAVDLPGVWIPVQVQGVTVLRVVNGLIAEHVDYIGYQSMLAQIENFRRNRRQ